MSQTAVLPRPLVARPRLHAAPAPAPAPAAEQQPRRGFVLQVDLSEVAEDDLADLLRTVQNLADLAAEWFPNARTRAALTGPAAPARPVPSTQAFRERLRAVPSTPSLVIDPRRRVATVDGTPVELTTTELALLVHLAQAGPRVVGRAELLASVWAGRDLPDDSRTVDVHVRRLREKTRLADVVVTARGEGYRIAPGYEVDVLG